MQKAYLFGSTARGESGPGSDLDIMVELDPNQTIGLIEYIKIQMKLEDAFLTPVDMVSADGLSPYIKAFIDKDKTLIYEA